MLSHGLERSERMSCNNMRALSGVPEWDLIRTVWRQQWPEHVQSLPGVSVRETG